MGPHTNAYFGYHWLLIEAHLWRNSLLWERGGGGGLVGFLTTRGQNSPNKNYNLFKTGVTLIFSAVQAYLTQPFRGVFHSLLASEDGIAKTTKTTKITGKKISLILNRCLEINDVVRNVFRASTGSHNGGIVTLWFLEFGLFGVFGNFLWGLVIF